MLYYLRVPNGSLTDVGRNPWLRGLENAREPLLEHQSKLLAPLAGPAEKDAHARILSYDARGM